MPKGPRALGTQLFPLAGLLESNIILLTVEKTATRAGARGQKQWKPQATEEQQHTEELGGKKRNVGEEGKDVNGSPDMAPDCDLKRACSVRDNCGQMVQEE